MESSARCSIGYSPRFVMSFIQSFYSVVYNLFDEFSELGPLLVSRHRSLHIWYYLGYSIAC